MPHQGEHDRRRVERLRALAATLEQLPQSPARDRLLREVHHRTVMVDTGVPSISSSDADADPTMLFRQMAFGAFPRFTAQR